MNIQNKVEAWSKKLFKTALEEVRQFYLVSKVNGVKFNPAWYFEKAVDSAHFPDYYTIITNPIDLHSMSRKLNGYFNAGNSIDVAFQQILSDMNLMRDNAHTYNVGVENIEVRICADAVRNFFRYVIRSALKVSQNLGDDSFNSVLFASDFLQQFVKESEDEAILEFLLISNYNMSAILEKNNLIRDVGVKNINPEIRNRIQYFTVLQLIEGREAPSLPNPPQPIATTTGTSSSRRSSSATAPAKTTTKSKSLSRATSSSTNQRVSASNAFDDPWEADDHKESVETNAFDNDDFDDDVEAPSGRNLKRSRSEAYHLDPGAEEDPFEDFAQPSKSKKARSSATSTRQISQSVVEDDWQVPSIEQRPPWIEAAENIYKIITKHAYVDFNSKYIIADFFNPVVEQSPQLAEQYLAKIPHPMDLMQIQHMLFVEQSFLDAREFGECLQLIFQNCVDFNSSSGAEAFEFTQDLVAKSAYLRRYVRWLCLENLPLQDDTGMNEDEAEEQFGFLRVSEQAVARKEREALISQCYIDELNTPFTECKKLLKDLERTRTTEERRRLVTFFYPIDTVNVVDYSVYVRQPMDLSTLKFKLDGTEPTDPVIRKMVNMHAPRYSTFGQFLDDLRRIFSNAKKYNAVHKDDDTSGLSQAIYEAAIFFGDRLESLLPKFSLTLADKVECTRLNKTREKREMEEFQRKQQEEEAEKQQIKARLMEEMKQKDEKYALDTDIERKVQQMEKEVAMRRLAAEKAILEKSLATSSHMASGAGGDISPATQGSNMSPHVHSPDGLGALSPSTEDLQHRPGNLQDKAVALAAAEVTGTMLSGDLIGNDKVVHVAGCGALGVIPPDWEKDARRKLNSRKKAWDLFAWDIPPTQPAAARSQSISNGVRPSSIPANG